MKEEHIKKYGKISELLASFSKDPKLKVGCLIVKNGRIVSTGYNGTLPGHSHKIIEDEKGHTRNTVHAEQNALMNCSVNGISTKECEAIVSHFPCEQCTKLLIMAGINKIHFVHDYKNDSNLFKEDIEIRKIYI